MAVADSDVRSQHLNVLQKVEDLFLTIALLPAELREDVFQKIRIKLTVGATTQSAVQETDWPIGTSEKNIEDKPLHAKSGNACDKALGQVGTGGKAKKQLPLTSPTGTKNLINKENSKQKKGIKQYGKLPVKTNSHKGEMNKSQPEKCAEEKGTTRVSLRIKAKKTIKKSLTEVEKGNDQIGNNVVNHGNATSSNTCDSQKKPDKTIKKSLIEEHANGQDNNNVVNHSNATSSSTCDSQKKPDKTIKKPSIEVELGNDQDGNAVVNHDNGTRPSSNTCVSQKKQDQIMRKPDKTMKKLNETIKKPNEPMKKPNKTLKKPDKTLKKSLVEEDVNKSNGKENDGNDSHYHESDGNESDINDADKHDDPTSMKYCDIPMRTFMVPHSFRQKDVNRSQTAEDKVKTASTENAEDAGQKEQRTKPCYGCMQCPRNFIQRHHLVIHMRAHTGEKPFVCPTCKKGFSQKGALSVHMQAHEGSFNHDCNLCDYRTVRKIDMIRHVARMHSGERNYVCETCGKSFSTDTDLKDHTKNVHERASQQMCHLCGYVTHRADNLQRHLRVCHSTCEQHECPVCGRLIKQRGTFLAHLRTHTGERPYACSQCKKAFKSNSQLATHMLTHGAGTFQCEVCSRLFKTRCHLLRHAFVHTGVKPYQCPHCEYSCNVTHNLNKHVRAVHGIADFAWFKVAPVKKGQEKEAEDGANEEDRGGSDVEEAKEKGKAAAAHFLSRMSLRKDEGLTVSDLKIQLEAEQSSTAKTLRQPSTRKRPLSARKSKRKKRKIEDDEPESDEDEDDDDHDLITEADQTAVLVEVIRTEDNVSEIILMQEELGLQEVSALELETAIAVANASVLLL